MYQDACEHEFQVRVSVGGGGRVMACGWGCLLAPVELLEPACARLGEAWLGKVRAWGYLLAPVRARQRHAPRATASASGCVRVFVRAPRRGTRVAW